MENTTMNLQQDKYYTIKNKATGDVSDVYTESIEGNFINFVDRNNGEPLIFDIDVLLNEYEINPQIKDDILEGVKPQLNSLELEADTVIIDDNTEPQTTNCKNFDITRKLTDEELVEIADKQNILIGEKIKLEADLDSYQKEMRPKIKEREARIESLHNQYETKEVTRTMTIEPITDWAHGLMRFFNPENNVLLEECPIPEQIRQQEIGFEQKNEPEEVEQNRLVLWYDFAINYEGVEKPKGITDKRLGKIKNDILKHPAFKEIASKSLASNGSAYVQNGFVLQLWSLIQGIMLEKGLIKK